MIQENGLTLAYIGDAIYELKIREYLLTQNYTKVNDLHKHAIKYTSAISQAQIIDYLMPNLTEEEIEYYKRGRNTGGTHKPKNASLNDYRKATGFEALIGYLYLIKNLDRMDELINKSINYINSKNDYN
ncbi:Mini-ribonuclease 3 [bacterium]|nr:Mini-ribonuclease 3 [bacterium]